MVDQQQMSGSRPPSDSAHSFQVEIIHTNSWTSTTWAWADCAVIIHHSLPPSSSHHTTQLLESFTRTQLSYIVVFPVPSPSLHCDSFPFHRSLSPSRPAFLPRPSYPCLPQEAMAIDLPTHTNNPPGRAVIEAELDEAYNQRKHRVRDLSYSKAPDSSIRQWHWGIADIASEEEDDRAGRRPHKIRNIRNDHSAPFSEARAASRRRPSEEWAHQKVGWICARVRRRRRV